MAAIDIVLMILGVLITGVFIFFKPELLRNTIYKIITIALMIYFGFIQEYFILTVSIIGFIMIETTSLLNNKGIKHFSQRYKRETSAILALTCFGVFGTSVYFGFNSAFFEIRKDLFTSNDFHFDDAIYPILFLLILLFCNLTRLKVWKQ